MFQLLKRFVGCHPRRGAAPARTADRPKARPRLEALEARDVPNAGLRPVGVPLLAVNGIRSLLPQPAASISYDAATRTVTVTGSRSTGVGDLVYVRPVAGVVDVAHQYDNRIEVRQFRPDEVSRVVFNGNEGNDVFQNDTGIASTALGGPGDDSFVGGPGADQLFGGPGHDSLTGRSGDDTLHGDDGNDRIEGGNGNDVICGGDGQDNLSGDDGSDQIEGGNGNDMIRGGDGHDLLFGDTPADPIIVVFAPDDWPLNLVYSPPVIASDPAGGQNFVYGEGGNDTITGGTAGGNYLSGGDGYDVLTGRGFADNLSGGAGDDRLTSRTTSYLYGGEGNDRLFGVVGFDHAYGGGGNDYIKAGDFGWNDLHGGDGDDELYGAVDRYRPDHLYGDNGNDRLNGGADGCADILYGGAGADRFWQNYQSWLFFVTAEDSFRDFKSGTDAIDNRI